MSEAMETPSDIDAFLRALVAEKPSTWDKLDELASLARHSVPSIILVEKPTGELEYFVVGNAHTGLQILARGVKALSDHLAREGKK